MVTAGWLTGKYRRDTDPVGATRLGEDPARGMEAWEPRNKQSRTWSIIDTVGRVTATRGLNHAQVALAWLATRPAVTSVIFGARTTAQLTANLGAAEIVLTAAETAHLDAVSTPVVGDYPYDRALQGEHPDSLEFRAAMVHERRLLLRRPLTRAYGWAPDDGANLASTLATG